MCYTRGAAALGGIVVLDCFQSRTLSLSVGLDVGGFGGVLGPCFYAFFGACGGAKKSVKSPHEVV